MRFVGVVVAALICTSIYAHDKKPASNPFDRVVLAIDTGGHTSPVQDLAFTPDGKKLVTVETREVHVWDLATGHRERRWRLPIYALVKTALAPNGRTVAVASDLLWNPETRRRYTAIWLLDLVDGHAHRLDVEEIGYQVNSLQFSPDSKRLAWSTWYQAGVIDHLFKKGRVTCLIERGGEAKTAWFSPDGTQLLVGGGHKGIDQCQVYDVRLPAKRVQIEKPIFALEKSVFDIDAGMTHPWQTAWAPDGKRIAAWAAKPVAIQLWRADGKRELAAKGSPRVLPLKGTLPFINLLQFTAADRLLAIGVPADNYVRAVLVDATSGKLARMFDFPFERPEHLRLAVTPDGKRLAVSSAPGFQVVVCDLEANKVVHRLGKAERAPNVVGWGPDSRSIAWNHEWPDDKWSLTSGLNLAALELLRRDDVKEFRAGRKYPKGWNCETESEKERSDKKSGVTITHKGKRIETNVLGPSGGAIFYRNSAGAMRAVIRSHWHEVIHIVNAETGKILHEIGWGHHFSVSPDDQYLLISRREQTVDIYRLAAAKEVDGRPQKVMSVLVFGRDWVAWTPRGYYAATPGGERLIGWGIKIDDATPLSFYPFERFRKHFFRPDVIQRVLDEGGMIAALKAANQAASIKTAPAAIEELLPPTVTLEIVDRSKLPLVKVRLSAVAQVKSQPITSLRVFLDGKPTFVHQRKDGADRIDGLTADVRLPGEKQNAPYQLTALAEGRDVYGFSDSVEVQYSDQGKLPVMHVLAIGINTYDVKSLRLGCAAQDAGAILNNLQKCAGKGGLFKNVVGKCVLDANAERATILAELECLQRDVNDNDLAVIFFAGHGLKNRDDFYLLTKESVTSDLQNTALSGSELAKRLGGFRCQVLLLLDACHSGAFSEQRHVPATDDAIRTLTAPGVGVTVLTAAMGGEKARERNGHGLFTNAIVKALNKTKGVPFTKDNLLFIDQLWSYVLHDVRDASDGEQHPFLKLPEMVRPFPIVRFAPEVGALR